MPYTIRGIPTVVAALRARARSAGKSLNEVVVDALAASAGVPARKRRDLSDVAGTWKTDKAVESALSTQDEPDAGLWR